MQLVTYSEWRVGSTAQKTPILNVTSTLVFLAVQLSVGDIFSQEYATHIRILYKKNYRNWTSGYWDIYIVLFLWTDRYSVRGGDGVSRHLQLMTSNLILTKRILFYISPQEREISVPILSRSAFPRSCTKFAFPRARVPKMPGTRERETKNARPSLYIGFPYQTSYQ